MRFPASLLAVILLFPLILGVPALGWPQESQGQTVFQADFSLLPSLEAGGWQDLVFHKISKHTRYEQTGEGIRAESHAGASFLAREVPFSACPGVHVRWRWKVDSESPGSGGPGKEGDDYAARLAVAFAYDSSFYTWLERLARFVAIKFYGMNLPGVALEYVWSSARPEGSIWPNPFTRQVQMLSVGGGEPGTWKSYERDLCEDFQRAFGRLPPPGTGIFFMTDADNTGGVSVATFSSVELLGPAQGSAATRTNR